jgi:peptidoglycan/xylan/chitin deacetylase (PgdA/CDA1 family)
MDRDVSPRVCLTFDVDGPFLWLGTFGTRGLQGLSRGEYEVRVGLPRVLELLREKSVPATFFVPGRFAETYPALVREIAAGPHEVAAHGYNHERWPDLSREAEEKVLERSIGALSDCLGTRPLGFRAPAFELNPWSIRLLVEAGFAYDSSLMADDFTPYRPRVDDPVSDEGPLRFGEPAPILEFPVSWELDDFPYFAHTSRNAGLRSAREVAALWFEEWEFARTVPAAVYTLTLHPQVIGRGPRIRMLAELIDRIRAEGPVSFTTLARSLDAAGALQQPAGDHRL